MKIVTFLFLNVIVCLKIDSIDINAFAPAPNINYTKKYINVIALDNKIISCQPLKQMASLRFLFLRLKGVLVRS